MKGALLEELNRLVIEAEKRKASKDWRESPEGKREAALLAAEAADLEVKRIIERIPVEAGKAAARGERSLWVLNNLTHGSVIEANVSLEDLELRFTDPIATAIYRWCKEQGLNPRADYRNTDYGSYKGPNQISIMISW